MHLLLLLFRLLLFSSTDAGVPELYIVHNHLGKMDCSFYSAFTLRYLPHSDFTYRTYDELVKYDSLLHIKLLNSTEQNEPHLT